MKVSAVLTRAAGSSGPWLAQCEEIDRTGEGDTPEEAIASLREALRDYFDVQAVAPPTDAPPSPIEIVVVGGAPADALTS